MNKAIKVISISMMVALMIFALVAPVLANDDLVSQFDPSTDSAGTQSVRNVFNSVIGIVQVVGTGIAIIMLIVLAIRYIVASAEDKADIKKSSIQYVVAAVILFAAVNILAVIEKWTNANINENVLG